MADLNIDDDVDHFAEQDVNIQLGLLALCQPHEVHSKLQDGQLKSVADLKWKDASFTARDCCIYTLTTKFQSDDVARRFHGDFMQQLNHRKFAGLRKLARSLSDEGCLLLTVSLATDRIVLKVVHEEAVQSAQYTEARVAMVSKAMKKELIPRWSREGEKVELWFHSEDERSHLDQKLSDLEETNRSSGQKSEEQQETDEDFVDLATNEDKKMAGNTLEHDLKRLVAEHQQFCQRQQEVLTDAEPSTLLSPGVPQKQASLRNDDRNGQFLAKDMFNTGNGPHGGFLGKEIPPHDVNPKFDSPLRFQHRNYDKTPGGAGAGFLTNGWDGHKSTVSENAPYESGTGKNGMSSQASDSPPSEKRILTQPMRKYNYIPRDPKDQPPEMDQRRAAGTESNGAQGVHHNHNDLSAGPSVNNHNPPVPNYKADSNAQRKNNDPEANGGKQGHNKNESGQDQVPKSGAETPKEEPRPYGYHNGGKHYQRQSRTRMVERLDWATTLAAIEETPSPRARRGMDTVLCLDNSLSMLENGAFQDMKKVALDFIEGLEEMVERDLEENVAVVSMGGGARVLQHLTNDYNLVRTAIESLEPTGWTPYFETLLVAMQCLNRRGKVIGVGRHHRIRARILCLTDGNPSDETSNPLEGMDPTMNDTNFRIMFVQKMPEMKTHLHDICWVPVGQNTNKTILQTLEKLEVGTVVEREDRGRLHCRYFTQNLLGHMLCCKPLMKEGNVVKEKTPQDAGDTDVPDISEYEPLFMALATDVTEEDKEEVRRCLRAIISKPQETTLGVEESDFSSAHVDPTKLPLGTRVVRGPDWQCGEQDGGMAGTVVKHRRRDGKIEVEWDHGGREPYRYEQGGVLQVTEAPAGTPPVFLEDRMICVGASVQRGPDWSAANEDGGPGSVGVVIGCRDDGRVKVAWKNGMVSVYNFGKHDLYEVFVREEAHVQAKFGSHTSGKNMYDNQHHGGTSRAGQSRPVEGVTLWQWQDDKGQWTLYSQDNQDKLSKAFARKPTGSCLITRGGQNYRVLFAENMERCIVDKIVRRVQKIVVDDVSNVEWPSDDHPTSAASPGQREFDASTDISPDLLEKAQQKLTCPEGINITPEDLKTLESNKWLDDTIIHAFLGVVAQQRGAVVLPSFLAVKLESQQHLEPDWYRPRATLSTTKWILLPVFTSSHWLLLAMDVEKRLVHVLDSMPRQDRKNMCFQFWMSFLRGRAKVKAEADLPLEGWQLGQLASKRQAGSGDCGVYVCVNAEAMLEHGGPAQDVQMAEARRHIYVTVVTHGRPVTSSALQ